MKGMHLLRDSSEPLNTFHWPGLIRRGTTYDCNSYSLIYLVACKKQSCSYIRDEEVVPCSSTFLPFLVSGAAERRRGEPLFIYTSSQGAERHAGKR